MWRRRIRGFGESEIGVTVVGYWQELNTGNLNLALCRWTGAGKTIHSIDLENLCLNRFHIELPVCKGDSCRKPALRQIKWRGHELT